MDTVITVGFALQCFFVFVAAAAVFIAIKELLTLKIRTMTVEQLREELGEDFRELRYVDKRKVRDEYFGGK
jgi:hypothetical protein